ncbi:MAG: DUF3576 domain-containing protein [Flavobacteriaceae bacterium]
MTSKNKLLSLILIIYLSLMLNSCKFLKKEEPVTKGEEQIVIKKKRLNPNMKERVLERETPGIFNSSRLKKSTTYDFATANVMWRATLETLDFMPLTSVNYSGGLVLTDWYSSKLNSNESIKIEVRFLDNELKASSIKVNSFKKKCIENNNCKIVKSTEKFNSKIKNNILEKARVLKIASEQEKNKKK